MNAKARTRLILNVLESPESGLVALLALCYFAMAILSAMLRPIIGADGKDYGHWAVLFSSRGFSEAAILAFGVLAFYLRQGLSKGNQRRGDFWLGILLAWFTLMVIFVEFGGLLDVIHAHEFGQG